MQSHLRCTFAELEVTFCKHYRKLQTNEHVLYGFESHQTSIGRKSASILWMYIEISKLFESESKWQSSYNILST
jgi:hypothetical protein